MKTTADTFYNDPFLQLFVERVTAVLHVSCIFDHLFEIPSQEPCHQLYVILRPGGVLGLLESRELCHMLLEDRPGYRALVLPASDITKKSVEGNIRTMLVCHPDRLVYLHPQSAPEKFFPETSREAMVEQAEKYFEKESARIEAFEEGFRFYLRKGKLTQAGFMLHQTMELGFRTAEALWIGKEKITHSLKNHQLYISPFYPPLGQLFATEEELILLDKLDQAYKATRYEQDFPLSTIELIVGSAKADKLLNHMRQIQDTLIRDLQEAQTSEPHAVGSYDKI